MIIQRVEEKVIFRRKFSFFGKILENIIFENFENFSGIWGLDGILRCEKGFGERRREIVGIERG